MLEKVGVFGGTFDPIHNGHIVVADDFRHDLGLDCIIFVVAGDPYQKDGVSPFGIRFDMTRRALRYVPWAKVDADREPGPSYMIDTLESLAKPDRELHLLVGQDQYENRHTWHRWDDIAFSYDVHVSPRWMGISSTNIRERVRNGRNVQWLVPDAVQLYIADRRLYRREL